MSLSVEWSPRAERDGRRLDRQTRTRIHAAIDHFAETGHGDTKRLKGRLAGKWRLRVGDWRVLFRPSVPDNLIEILRILPRGEAYRVRETAEQALLAPFDDEPETDVERRAVELGVEAFARGDVRPLEDVAREMGL